MKNLFRFDVTLKDLMNLGERSREFSRLRAVFGILKKFWYHLPNDPEGEKERWNRIRVGSVVVFLDEDKNLHLDFVTRFTFENCEPVLKALDIVSMMPDNIELPDFIDPEK